MSEWIKEGSSDNFQQVVIDRSHHVPVLVDFWAPWCQPCKTLAPTLEAAVSERKGDVELVKINTDQNQALSQQFGIRGIPAVKVFIDGKVSEEFTGVVDRRAIDTVIDNALPTEGERLLKAAALALAEERQGEVPSLLDPLANQPKYQDRALLLIAEAYAKDQKIGQALSTLEAFDENSPEAPKADALATRLRLVRAAEEIDEELCRQRFAKDETDREASWALAGHCISAKRYGEALELLMGLLQQDRTFHNDGARKAMLAIFEQLTPDNELVDTYRRRMQIYL